LVLAYTPPGTSANHITSGASSARKVPRWMHSWFRKHSEFHNYSRLPFSLMNHFEKPLSTRSRNSQLCSKILPRWPQFPRTGLCGFSTTRKQVDMGSFPQSRMRLGSKLVNKADTSQIQYRTTHSPRPRRRSQTLTSHNSTLSINPQATPHTCARSGSVR
jgi:hypothetical protein